MQFVYESTTLEQRRDGGGPMAFMGSEDIDDGDWDADGGVGALWSGLAPSGLAESYPHSRSSAPSRSTTTPFR